VIPGDPGISLGVLALEPVLLRTRTLSLEPRQFRLRAIGTDPYPGIFSRGREPRDLTYLRTMDVDNPNVDAWVKALFARWSHSSDEPSPSPPPAGLATRPLIWINCAVGGRRLKRAAIVSHSVARLSKARRPTSSESARASHRQRKTDAEPALADIELDHSSFASRQIRVVPASLQTL
jgi:hypothetical protein